jgi:alkylated DNA repair dioxygenase AlkB
MAASTTCCLPSWAIDAAVYGSNDSFLLLNILSDEEADEFFYALCNEIKWNTMRQNGKRVPRGISIQGTITIVDDDEYEPLYRHPADEQPELLSWTATATKIQQRIEQVVKQEFNHALIQSYRTSKDSIGEHSDKTLDIKFGSNIVNFSLGAARKMLLINKTNVHMRQELKLPHNSLFVLGWRTNREWKHAIYPDRRSNIHKDSDELAFCGQRISLTLRTVATYLNRRTGQIYGQGARYKTIDELSHDNEQNTFDNDDIDMVRAFSAENRQAMDFDWHAVYGRGFNALNFKFLNSRKTQH